MNKDKVKAVVKAVTNHDSNLSKKFFENPGITYFDGYNAAGISL